MKGIFRTTLAVAASMVIGTSVASAQATRTWVSGVGDDANPCSRTAPCKTFAGAISKTAPGGEISVLDPGGFGGVTITKSITINGESQHAGILVSGTNAIVISAGSTDTVKLKNLDIDGIGTGLTGIKFLAGAGLIVEDVFVYGFDTGIETNAGNTTILHSIVTQSRSFGVNAKSGSAVVLDSSTLSHNNVGGQAATGGVLRLSNNGIYNNLTSLGCGGGTLGSANNNRLAGNYEIFAPVCTPTEAMTIR